MKKLLFYYKELIATFWFVPVLIIVLSIFLSIGLVSLDSYLNLTLDGFLQFFLVNSANSARTILSTISGAMIGVAGTVFSVTLVALTLASSQFGPRLIKNFMYVKLNQVVLGSYIATYLYCLLILNAVKDNNGYTFIPSISILVAILFAMVNIILLIVFIHQIATSIQADKVIADISILISKQVKTIFPEEMGDEIIDDEEIDVTAELSGYKEKIALKSNKSGYIRYIESDGLIAMVKNYNSLLILNHRPGDYIVKGMEIGEIYSNDSLEKENIDLLLNKFIFGKTKTSQQDIEFSIHQMVEIAARALSPGVNDPYTAIACIDNLTTTMSYLARVKFPSKYRYDDDEKLRVVASVLDFEGVLDAAFNQIRQFSGGSTAVIIRLMKALTVIQEFTITAGHKRAVKKHAQMVLTVSKQTIKEENDLNDLKERTKQILNE